jgi:hypothetical protein
MNPHEQYEISPTEKPSGQSHTPGQVFNLVLAAQNGSVEACMEVSRCFTEGDGVPENQVAACAWLLVAATDGSEEAEEEFALLASRLSTEEIQKVVSLAKGYSNPSAPTSYSDWVAGFRLMTAEKLAQQEGQKLTTEELVALLYRADEDDEEALRIVDPMLDALREQMTPEELAILEQQIIDSLSAVRENQTTSFNKDRKII